MGKFIDGLRRGYKKQKSTLVGDVVIPNLKVEILEPVLSKGFPKEADFKALDNLADAIAQKHKEYHFA